MEVKNENTKCYTFHCNGIKVGSKFSNCQLSLHYQIQFVGLTGF